MKKSAMSFLQKNMGKFTYPQKFLLISLMFVIALSIVGYFMIKAQNFTINFGKQELRGNQYQRAIQKVFIPVNEHYILVNRYLGGEEKESIQDSISSLKAKADAGFESLLGIDELLKKTLLTQSQDFQIRGLKNLEPKMLKNNWDQLKNKDLDLTLEISRSLHRNLIDDLRAFTTHIGDTSNLILDPDVDSYYLMDSTLIRMPEQQDLFSQIITQIESHFFAGTLNEREKARIANLVSLLSSSVEGTYNGVKKAYLETRNLKDDFVPEQELQELLNEYSERSKALFKQIELKILSPNEVKRVDLQNTANLGAQALEANYKLWDAAIDQMDRLLKIRIQKFKRQQTSSIFLSSLAVLTGFSFGLFIMIQISRQIKFLTKGVQKVRTGDLTARVPIIYFDELGKASEAFNEMTISFDEMIGRLQKSERQLNLSTSQIAASAKEQERVITEQETVTKEIEVIATQISSTTKDFAKTMNEVNASAEETSNIALSSKDGLADMKEVMGQMVDASEDIAAKLAVLSEKAAGINNIITTITKVADQTNLLSLNAAIEAEKAGEHGRSFSVIAREIRRLADQAAHATLDIEKMVNEMGSAVTAGVMSVDKFQKDISIGVDKASTVGEQLSNIIKQVQVQTSNFEGVNEGVQNQSLAAEKTKNAIIKLTESAKKTTESIKQFDVSVADMNRATRDMEESMQLFKQS